MQTDMNTADSTIWKFVIAPVLKFCKIFAITPWDSSKTVDTSRQNKLYKCYALFLITTFLLSLASAIYGVVVYFPTTSTGKIMKIIDSILFFSITAANLTAISVTVFLKSDVIKDYMCKVVVIDDFLPMKRCSRFFWKMMIGFSIIVGVTVCLDSVISIASGGWHYFRFYIFREYQYVHYSVMVFASFYFACIIRCKLILLNKFLTDSVILQLTDETKTELWPVMDPELSGFMKIDHKFHCQMLKNVAKWYNLIADLVEVYNSIFGQLIFIVTLCTITLLLNYVVILIVGQFKLQLIILVVLWVVVALVS